MVGSGHLPVIDGIEGLVLVGEGGFAVVYRGRQPAFRRDVAVKVLQRTGLDEADRARFDRECQAMGALSDHPGIVTLYDAGFTTDGRPYLVMQYIQGGTLADRLAAGGPMGWQEVTTLGVRLCGALETAHRAHVLHRDIKPANILRSEYGDQLSDFGIARIQGGHETRSGVITASIAHAAPEILDGRRPSPQADVYSLASTLFHALAGQAAFVKDTDEGLLPVMRRVLTEPPPDLRERGVPGVVAALIENAMAKEPEQRYASAEAFGLALRGAQAVLGIHVADLVIVGARLEGADVGAGNGDGTDAPAGRGPDGSDVDADAPGDAGAGTDAGATTDGATTEDAATDEAPDRTRVVAPPGHDGPDTTPDDVGDGSSGPGARPSEVPPPAGPAAPVGDRRRPGRRRKLAAIGGGLLGAAAIVGTVLWLSDEDARAPDSADGTTVATTVAPATTLDPDVSTTLDPDPSTTLEPDVSTTVATTIVDPADVGVGVLAPGLDATHPAVVGLTRAAADLDLTLISADPDLDAVDALTELVDSGQNPIVAFDADASSDAIRAMSDAHPDVTFVVFDSTIEAPNVVATSFAEHEGSFVVGAIAAQTSTTGRVGFIGGVDDNRIRRYEAGFVAGARHVAPAIQVDVRFLPTTSDTDERTLERDTAAAMYELGADVIYHAGTDGAGLFEAAAEAGRWAIGSDIDRALDADDAVRPAILTSMVKSYEASAYAALEATANETLVPGVTVLGLADGGVTWSSTGGHVDPVADATAALADEIATGAVEAPSVVGLRALAPLGPDCPAEGCRARILAAEVTGAELTVTLEANWFMDVAGNHVHWFWSPRFAANQVGTDSATRFGVEVGEWDIDDRYPEYVTEGVVSLSVRTPSDTMLCVTPADALHNVIDPGLVDCLTFGS